MKRRLVIIVAVLVLALAALALIWLRGKTYTIELTEAQIQERLDERFPMTKRYGLVLALTLSEPKVRLKEGSDRISFSIKANAPITLPGQSKSLSGTGKVTTGLEYRADDYSFYLTDPKIDALTIQGIPVEFVDRVNDLAMKLAHDRINNYPIYTLRREELKQLAASLVLRDLTVKDGKLVITLGL